MSARPIIDDACLHECTVCENSIPPLLLTTGPRSMLWECRTCGATYQGRLARNDKYDEQLIPVGFFPNTESIPKPNAEMQRFVVELLERDRDRLERRGAPRRPVMIAVPALRLDAQLLTVGDPFTMVSRDISTTGIAMVHEEPIRGMIGLLLEVPSQGRTQLIAEVVRCGPVMQYYEIGACFRGKLSAPRRQVGGSG